MAWYSIDHECGHTERHQIPGSNLSRIEHAAMEAPSCLGSDGRPPR